MVKKYIIAAFTAGVSLINLGSKLVDSASTITVIAGAVCIVCGSTLIAVSLYLMIDDILGKYRK